MCAVVLGTLKIIELFHIRASLILVNLAKVSELSYHCRSAMGMTSMRFEDGLREALLLPGRTSVAKETTVSQAGNLQSILLFISNLRTSPVYYHELLLKSQA